MKTLLFLCTGNYYRSRFAELYFRHLARAHQINWQVDSRGLELNPDNEGPLSQHTVRECEKLGISTEPVRWPMPLQEADLIHAELTIAVKETEHRPLVRQKFSRLEERIEYWEIHDLDVEGADESLPQLRKHVDLLAKRLLLCQS